MYILYLDESGGAEPCTQDRDATPAMAIVGLIVDARLIHSLTREFLELKRRYFPGRFRRGPALDHILAEVKGSQLLNMTRSNSRDKRRHARVVRQAVLELLDRFGCKVIGRVWVKRQGEGLKPDPTYCVAVQEIAAQFNRFLAERNDEGVILADSRMPNSNSKVAHSIFTQKWRAGGDAYPRLREVPAFVHSENHAGIQLADLLASTFILPMAASAYGAPTTSVHSSERYDQVRSDHGEALKTLQYTYLDPDGWTRGGLVVSDPFQRSSELLFQSTIIAPAWGQVDLMQPVAPIEVELGA